MGADGIYFALFTETGKEDVEAGAAKLREILGTCADWELAMAANEGLPVPSVEAPEEDCRLPEEERRRIIDELVAGFKSSLQGFFDSCLTSELDLGPLTLYFHGGSSWGDWPSEAMGELAFYLDGLSCQKDWDGISEKTWPAFEAAGFVPRPGSTGPWQLVRRESEPASS